jgi:parvulin-like peptidyl-prolyl isomerase
MRTALIVLSFAAASAAFAAPSPTAAIATVDGQAVTVEELDRAFAVAVRQKFYHRAPPEGQVEEFRREVAEGLIDRVLLLAEARKRGLAADPDAIQRTLDAYEQRYANSPSWKAMREGVLPKLRRELEEKQLLSALEAAVRAVPAPDEAGAREFYERNLGLFREPERLHVSMILLKVDPSAPKPVRDAARAEGRDIEAQLAAGAEFAQIARVRSSDASGARGGDLGYIHRGMLGEDVQGQLDRMKAGETSKSFDVLEGVAVLRLHERVEPKQREFSAVAARASDLLRRELSDKAWKGLAADLRRGARIERDGASFPAGTRAEAGAQEGRSWAAADGAAVR